VTVVADDGNGGTAKVTFTVTVREVNRLPALSVSPGTVKVQYSDPVPTLEVTARDGDLPRQDLSLTVSGLPAGLGFGPLAFDKASGAWTAKATGRVTAPAGTFPVTVAVSDGAGGVAAETLTVTVEPESVDLQATGSTTFPVDGKDGDLDQLVVPFTVTEEADGSPSSQLPGTRGTLDAAPVTVTAVDPDGRTFRCADGSLDPGADGSAAGSCVLQNVPAGVYDVRLEVDNGRFHGVGQGAVAVEGAAPTGSTGYVFGAGKVGIAGKRAVCFGVAAWTTRSQQARGGLVIGGSGPGPAWRLRSTAVSTHRGVTSRTGEVIAKATLTQLGKPSRPVTVKLWVEDRGRSLTGADSAWVGVYDAAGRLLPDYSSAGSPPGGARPVLGEVRVGTS
jgi:hypothetical protein